MLNELTKSPQGRIAHGIARKLRLGGFSAHFAGGCVRDALLGLSPQDIDIATSARPDEIMAMFPECRAVGASFGVVLVRIGEFDFEVATYRSEGEYSDGRRPDSVNFCSPEEDVKRRDFTVNAMLYDPEAEELMDIVGGRADLEARIIRAVGNPEARFSEDHLRMLRAARFSAKLGFEIETATAEAIRKNAGLIERISSERIAVEMEHILTGRRPAFAIRLMDELGLLERILPEVVALKGIEQPRNLHPEGDVFTHTMICLDRIPEHPSFELALATLLHDIGKPDAQKESPPGRFFDHERIGVNLTRHICKRLKLSKKTTDRVLWLVGRHMCFLHAPQMRLSKLKTLFAEDGFGELAEIHKVDAMASSGDLSHYDLVMKIKEGIPEREISPDPLIRGKDLIRMGLEPGPVFSKILKQVREAQLDGTVKNRREAREMAGRLAADLQDAE
ncbi:MAG TPA: CCA tRNA nucleotidyltransferase [Candidatus Brocadiia bacterium]|nr:CCA tRNA nucleotidyltransferase [Candidatus Brocadiia bacterium]